MDQLVNVLLAINKTHVPQRGSDYRPGLGRLNQVYRTNHPTPSAQSIYDKYNNIFTRCNIRNQFDILMTVVADGRKGQTSMPYKGKHQTLTRQSMTHQFVLSYNHIRIHCYHCGVTYK